MNIPDYPSNSHRSRESEEPTPPPKKLEKVVTGKVSVRESQEKDKGLLGRMFTSDFATIKDYLINDVLVPSLQKGVRDLICTGAEMLFGGGAPSSNSRASRISYRSCYDDNNRRSFNSRGVAIRDSDRANQDYHYDDILFETRGDAEEILYRMEELVDRFGLVSVADLFDMAGISGNYTDNKYGWKSLGNAQVVRERDGYVIRLPRVIPL